MSALITSPGCWRAARAHGAACEPATSFSSPHRIAFRAVHHRSGPCRMASISQLAGGAYTVPVDVVSNDSGATELFSVATDEFNLYTREQLDLENERFTSEGDPNLQDVATQVFSDFDRHEEQAVDLRDWFGKQDRKNARGPPVLG